MQMTNNMDTSNALPLFVSSVSSRARDHDLLLPVFFPFHYYRGGEVAACERALVWKSENWQESFPSIHHVSLRHQTLNARLCDE